MNKAVFLDRDGVINKDLGYVHKIDEFIWLPGVKHGIKILKENGYLVIVISNQSGIGRGFYSSKDLKKLNFYINTQLKKIGTKIDAFYHCSYHPKFGLGAFKKSSFNRKPNPGMFLKAKKKYKIDFKKSFFIGDQLSDKAAAKKAKIKFFQSKNNFKKLVLKIIKNKKD
jgi:D-glycero-D-manno-heptose 1,7-bisphosphate phosphatase